MQWQFSPALQPLKDVLRACLTVMHTLQQAEEALYYKSGQLVKLLVEWQGKAPTLAGRFEELMIELYERNYLELEVSLRYV